MNRIGKAEDADPGAPGRSSTIRSALTPSADPRASAKRKQKGVSRPNQSAVPKSFAAESIFIRYGSSGFRLAELNGNRVVNRNAAAGAAPTQTALFVELKKLFVDREELLLRPFIARAGAQPPSLGGDEEARLLLLADWAFREAAPLGLLAIGEIRTAERLQSFEQLNCCLSISRARDFLRDQKQVSNFILANSPVYWAQVAVSEAANYLNKETVSSPYNLAEAIRKCAEEVVHLNVPLAVVQQMIIGLLEQLCPPPASVPGPGEQRFGRFQTENRPNITKKFVGGGRR